MGGSAILNMNKTDTIFTRAKALLSATAFASRYKLIVVLFFVIVVSIFLSLFLKTRLGLAIRATGNNPSMVKSSSINPVITTTIGLVISNSFTALSGCLMAQAQKSVNIDIGSGMLTIALASLLIGRTFFGKKKVPVQIIGMSIGAIIFRLVYTLALRLDMPSYMLKLVSSVIVIMAISGPYLRSKAPDLARKLEIKKRKVSMEDQNA